MRVMDVYGQDAGLLVEGSYVVNGAYSVKIEYEDNIKKQCSFEGLGLKWSHPYVGSIIYDGNYNSTLMRFEMGERWHEPRACCKDETINCGGKDYSYRNARGW